MLVILWFTVLCFSEGAHWQHEMTDDEVERVLDYLESNEEIYIPNQSKVLSSKWYPRESSTSNPEGHLSSTTEYTTIYPSEGQSDNNEDDGYSPQPPENDNEDDGYSQQPPEKDYGHEYPVQIGSIRGIPGINFPNYKDIPLTHFRCSDKVYVPGFYADMETGCQVFHVCWPHRRESFLCPVGTIFNQAILACDYWYSSNCSLASHYYDVNAVAPHMDPNYKEKESLRSMIDSLLEVRKSDSAFASSKGPDGVSKENLYLSEITKFLPIKAKVVVYPKTSGSPTKIIAEASMGKTKKSAVEKARQKFQIHEVKPEYMVRPKSRAFPLRPHRKVAPIHKVAPMKANYSQKEIDRITDLVFDIVKKILRETESSLPVIDKGLQKSKREYEDRKNLPLTKLNPRFITTPVKLPKQHKRSIQSTTETPEVRKPHVPSKPQIKVKSLPSGKHTFSDFISGSRKNKALFQSTKRF